MCFSFSCNNANLRSSLLSQSTIIQLLQQCTSIKSYTPRYKIYAPNIVFILYHSSHIKLWMFRWWVRLIMDTESYYSWLRLHRIPYGHWSGMLSINTSVNIITALSWSYFNCMVTVVPFASASSFTLYHLYVMNVYIPPLDRLHHRLHWYGCTHNSDTCPGDLLL